MERGSALIVFSHLRWNSVFQRPHHIMTRLAKSHRIIFIEEPEAAGESPAGWVIETPHDGITVCRPRVPGHARGFSDEGAAVIASLLRKLMQELKIGPYLAWLYTPLAISLLDFMKPEAVIYDCMDALDKFANASPALVESEAELLRRADVVFTGGPSLFRRLQGRHHNVHCFSSSVDSTHFGLAKTSTDPVEQASLGRPRLGYFGVIDERLDLDLIDAAAGKHTDWQFVMIGPVVKRSPESLPRRQNIHYFGQQPYAKLPEFLAGWDVCLMPFARNEATEFISPTKVLEYMAAERPIVSTPITDVAEPYGHIVYLANTAEEFVAACEEALSAGANERERRAGLMRRVLSSTSWDLTVDQMERLMTECLSEKNRIDAGSECDFEKRESSSLRAGRPVATRTAVQWARYRKAQPKVVVVGAGPTGLSAAYHLGKDALLLEQDQRVGGLCKSLSLNDFTFDYAGHIMFSNEPYVHKMYNKLLGDNVHWQDREAWIYSKNVYTRYPFQGALYGLPVEVIKECLMGAIDARLAASMAPYKGVISSNGNGGGSNHVGLPHADRPTHLACPGELSDCCGDGILESTAKLVGSNGNGQRSGNGNGNGNGKSADSESFEEFIYRVWGAGIAKHFAIPYNKKLWAVPLSEMETSWLGGRVPMPDLGEMIDGALRPVPKPMGPNARFGYPLRGGFQALMDGFLPFVKDRLRFNSRVVAVSPRARTITLADGATFSYQQLISTMPLPVLVRAMGNEAPPKVRDAVSKLRYVSVRCVHLGIGRENLTDKHWIYYPEDTVFHRIFVQGNASPHCNPPGGFGLTCEITYSEHKPLPCDGDELIERTIDDCQRVNFFNADDQILAATQVDLPFAYVVYDHGRAANVKLIRDWLATQGIILAGRYSEWEYYNSDHAFIAGKRAAEQAQSLFGEASRTHERLRIMPALSNGQFSQTINAEK